MTDNLKLWQTVEKTSPDHVKEITGKAYRGNSPKPHYVVHKATETFGPCGIGWGFSIVEEKLLDGAMLDPGFYERIHMARVRVWYEWEGKRGEVEHVGQTVFSGKRKNSGAPFTDEDAPKKSVTDALIKALSMIGFAGDIFMGRYDDSKYVAELRQEEREAAQPEPSQDDYDTQALLLDDIKAWKTADDAKAWRNNKEKVAAFRGLPPALMKAVQGAAAKRSAEFQPTQEAA